MACHVEGASEGPARHVVVLLLHTGDRCRWQSGGVHERKALAGAANMYGRYLSVGQERDEIPRKKKGT